MLYTLLSPNTQSLTNLMPCSGTVGVSPLVSSPLLSFPLLSFPLLSSPFQPLACSPALQLFTNSDSVAQCSFSPPFYNQLKHYFCTLYY